MPGAEPRGEGLLRPALHRLRETTGERCSSTRPPPRHTPDMKRARTTSPDSSTYSHTCTHSCTHAHSIHSHIYIPVFSHVHTFTHMLHREAQVFTDSTHSHIGTHMHTHSKTHTHPKHMPDATTPSDNIPLALKRRQTHTLGQFRALLASQGNANQIHPLNTQTHTHTHTHTEKKQWIHFSFPLTQRNTHTREYKRTPQMERQNISEKMVVWVLRTPNTSHKKDGR